MSRLFSIPNLTARSAAEGAAPISRSGAARWATAGTLLVGIGVLLGVMAAGDAAVPGDVQVSTAVQRSHGSLLEMLAWASSRIVDVWPGFLLLAAVAAAACIARGRPELAVFVTAVAALRAVNVPLKNVYSSPRPAIELSRLGEHGDGFGYPSGHAFGAALVFGGIAVLAPRLVRSQNACRAIQTTALVLAVLVAWSRIWLGVHWPTDVAGGLAIGFGLVCLLNAGLVFHESRSFRT